MAASAVPHALGVRRRWLSLAAGVLVEAASGMFYAFSLYSIRLQTQFHLSQQNTDLIATMANVGGNFGVHIGFFYRRHGPRGTLLLAAVFGLSGWLMLWASMVQLGSWVAPYAVLLLCGLLQGHAQMVSDCAVMPALIANFPEDRGRVSGVAKSFVGLSGSLNAQVYIGAFAPSDDAPFNETFLLFIVAEWLLVCLVGAAVISHPTSQSPRDLTPSSRTSRRVLNTAFGAIFVLTALLATSSLAKLRQREATAAFIAVFVTFLSLLLYLSTRTDAMTKPHLQRQDASTSNVISIGDGDGERNGHKPLMAEHRGAISDGDAAPYAEAPLQKNVNTAPLCAPSTTAVPSIETLLPNAAGATAATNATANYASTGNERTCDTLGTTTCSTDVHTAAATADAVAAAATAVAATATTTPLVAPSLPPLPAEASPNLSLSQALCSFSYFAISFVGCCAGGSGLMLINNLGKISEVRGFSGDKARLVSLLSACNCIGRLSCGFLSDVALKRCGVARPTVLALTCGLMALSMLLLLLPGYVPLVASVAVGGFAFGGEMALVPPIASEAFGLQLLSQAYPFLPLGLVAGSFAIATLLTSAVYNASTAGDSGSWLLQEPFRLTGLVCTVISFLSAAVSMILSRRLRGEYARLRMLHSTEN